MPVSFPMTLETYTGCNGQSFDIVAFRCVHGGEGKRENCRETLFIYSGRARIEGRKFSTEVNMPLGLAARIKVAFLNKVNFFFRRDILLPREDFLSSESFIRILFYFIRSRVSTTFSFDAAERKM